MRKPKLKQDALQESMRMLGRKSFSRRGMQDALERKGYQEMEALEAVERLAEWGYLTDERFAEERIAHYRETGKGRIFVEYYLIEEGVSPEKARELMERFYPEEDELQIAQALTRSRVTRREDSQAERVRLRRKLTASGFSRKAIEACGYRDEET